MERRIEEERQRKNKTQTPGNATDDDEFVLEVVKAHSTASQQWRSQRGSNPHAKNSEDKNCRKYTKLKFARVKASSNDIINIKDDMQ